MPRKPTRGTVQLAIEIGAAHKAAFDARIAAEGGATTRRALLEDMIAHYIATVPVRERAQLPAPEKKKT